MHAYTQQVCTFNQYILVDFCLCSVEWLFIEKKWDFFLIFFLGYVLSHVVFYSATFLYVIVFRFYFMQNYISTTYFDSQEKFVTQLNLKNNVDNDDNN